MRILGISGSLRADSYNTRLLAVAARLLPADVEYVHFASLKTVPPFDDDDERNPPAAAVELRRSIERADAILIATPEYNSSIPGQLKNAIDWASRPKASAALRNKDVAVIGASTGMFGAVWAQAETRKALASAGARVIERELAVALADEQFGDGDELASPELRAELAYLLDSLLGAVRAFRSVRATETAH
jgi:chromate reductase